uniref:BAALC binder of MAP3K1 and KLF4 b n=1 Tax=Sphenodon punctatus TaxID=8508 RepID=A0A8D0GZ09_SPHPU
MGCGGSRTDGLEPRYLESWTKETESTWLTSTDADIIPLSSIQSIPLESSPESGFSRERSPMSAGKKARLCYRHGNLQWGSTPAQ